MQGEGRTLRTKYVSVRYCASPCSHPRVGLIVPRFGRTAVERNRLKRRFREAIRLGFLSALPPIDVLIRTLQRAYDLEFREVREEVSNVGQFLARS